MPRHRLCLAVAFMLILSALSVRADDKPAPIELATFENADKSFTVLYPKGWLARPDRNKVVAVAFGNPTNRSEAIAIGPVANAPGTTLEKWAESAKAAFKQRDPQFKPTEEGLQTIGDRKVWRIVFDLVQPAGTKLRFIHYLIPIQAKSFTLTFVTTPESYDHWLPPSEKIVASLKLAESAEKPVAPR